MNTDGSNERPLGVTGLPLAWLSSEELGLINSGQTIRDCSP